MKICIIATVASSIVGFRRELIMDLVGRGHQVFAFAIDYCESVKSEVRSLGATPIDYPLGRAGINPFSDIRSIMHLVRIIRGIKPDLVLCFFVKPVIYGSISGRLAGVRRCIAVLEGLGYVFTDLPSGLSFKQMFLRKIQVFLYRIALPCVDKLIFLNHDDPDDLLTKNKLKVKSFAVLGGIGVDLGTYPNSPPPITPVRFIFVGRLLAEKGIFEFIEAAQIVKRRYPQAEFVMLGGLDEENPGGLKRKQITKLLDAGIIEYPGHVDNAADWIAASSVFVLPSYREGFPRSTQEAMAIGRAVLTSDVPGCRETVEHGVNGFLIPRWDSSALAERMVYLIENPHEIGRMGEASYRMARERFEAKKVNQQFIEMLGLN